MDKEQKKIINKFCKYVITGKQEFMISTPPDPMYRVLAEEIERLRKENQEKIVYEKVKKIMPFD